MRAEDVPADIVEAAVQATHEHDRAMWEDGEPTTPLVWRDFWPEAEDQEFLLGAQRHALAAVWDQILERGKVEECPYTFAHTRHWCGNQSCRDS